MNVITFFTSRPTVRDKRSSRLSHHKWKRSGKYFQLRRKESESRPPTSSNIRLVFFTWGKNLYILFCLLSLSLFPNHPLMAFEESCDKYKTTFRYIQTFLQKVFNILSTLYIESCQLQNLRHIHDVPFFYTLLYIGSGKITESDMLLCRSVWRERHYRPRIARLARH